MVLKVKDWAKQRRQFTYNQYSKMAIRLCDGKEFNVDEEVNVPYIGFGKIRSFKNDGIHVYVEPDSMKGSVASIEIGALWNLQDYIRTYREMEGM